MSVTTVLQPWNPSHLHAIDETENMWPDVGLSMDVSEGVDDDDPMNGSLFGLSVSDEESNYGDIGYPDVDDESEVTFVAKRRKVEKAVPSGDAMSSASPTKTKKTGISRRVQGRLQNMLTLPFDVLFLIFSELGPMDLINLARTSKALRGVLMSRNSIWVWMVVRRNAGMTKVPDPPKDMSEPAWALLVFGPSVCSHCSTKNIHQVDFALRRRLCTTCRKNNFVPSIKFRLLCSDLNESVMDLLPYTKRGGWAHRRVSSSRFYWKQDLDEMGKKLAELEYDVDAGKPLAEQRLVVFRAEKARLAESIVQSSVELEKWAKEEAEVQARSARERRVQRRKDLKERILAAGFDSIDIDSIGMHAIPGANVDKELTEEAWKRLKSKIEVKLILARDSRLRKERNQREFEYKIKVERYYTDILRQILPMQRLYLPAISQARELSCFRNLLDLDRNVQQTEWEQAAERLLESLSEWMTERRDKYTKMLPLHPYVHDVPSHAMRVRLLSDPLINILRYGDGERVDFAGQLELATSVFRHPATNTILIGREVCHAWKLKGELEFVERGAAAVRALLRELGLNPAKTTASKLEQENRRFICASCPVGLSWIHRPWRACVMHFIDADHPYPRWRLVRRGDEFLRGDTLNDSVWTSLRPDKDKETWLCNHCYDYPTPSPSLFGRVERNRSEVSWHVQTEHNISEPTTDMDHFSYPMFV